MQNYTSANTSVNKHKVPAIYKSAAAKKYLPHAYALDYGCGKYDTGMDYARETYGTEMMGYDPYNRSEEYNAEAMDTCGSYYDVVLCSNVLNVIDTEWARREIIEDMAQHGDVLLISVYEGDKSGIGKMTKKDCWQRNKLTKDYLPEIQTALDGLEVWSAYNKDVHWKAHLEGKVIVCTIEEV